MAVPGCVGSPQRLGQKGKRGAGGGVPSPQHSWIPPQLGPMETLER